MKRPKTPNQIDQQDADKLTQQEIGAIRKMIAQHQHQQVIPTRIEFDRSDTVLKAVRLSRSLVEDIAKRERNFNRLVELLLWDYLGRDPRHLKKN